MEDLITKIVESSYLDDSTKEKLLLSIESNNFSETISLLYKKGYADGYEDAFRMYV